MMEFLFQNYLFHMLIPIENSKERMIADWGNFYPKVSIISRDDWIVKNCVGKSVLHLGCSDSPFTLNKVAKGTALHPKISSVASRIVGVDIDSKSLDLLRKVYPESQFEYCNVESQDFIYKFAEQDFDVVVCADIIEHLNNPGLMLANLEKIMNPGTKLIVTTINALSVKGVLRGLFSREAVHPDHVAYYSFSTLKHLLSRYGFESENELKTFLYPFLSRVLTFLQPPFYKLFPHTADGIAMIATKR
jgi:ubiquinone/menaquinone biosynthesis C-methylase UbiE